MKLVKSNTILILLILALMGCTLEPSEIGGNEPAQSITIFTPVINQLPTRSVRALIPPEGRDSEVDFYGTMFLPQLTHFTQTTVTDVASHTFPIQILGETVHGDFEIGPANNQYTLKYHLGDDDGYIEVTVDDAGIFTYSQYLLVEVGGDAGTCYMIHTIEGGQISQNGTIGEYVERGQLYYGFLQENEAGTSTSINRYQVGNAKTYIRGNDAMVYGVVDPAVVNDMASFSDEDLFLADKPKSDITVGDLVQKLEEIQSFAYARRPNSSYPVNDLYYFLQEDRYDGYFTYGGLLSEATGYPRADTRDKEIFEEHTGHSFEALGFPECDNIFQFLGDSLELEYSLVGDGDSKNWEESGDRTVIGFSVEESSIYMVPPGFNILDGDLNLLGSEDDYGNVGGEILELTESTPYYIGFLSSEFSLNEMCNYSYLYNLE